MNYLIDLIIVLVFTIVVIVSAKRGFVKTAVELVGFVLAFIISTNLGNSLANLTYDKAIEPPIVSAVTQNAADSTASIVDSTWDALPDIITQNSGTLGISKEFLNEKLGSTATVTEEALTELSQTAIKPIATKFLATLYSLILFIILLIVVGFLSKILNKLFSFSIIGKLNRFLGGIIGIPKGIICAYVFCLLLTLVLYLFPNGIWIFNSQNTDKSQLYTLLMSITPFKQI